MGIEALFSGYNIQHPRFSLQSATACIMTGSYLVASDTKHSSFRDFVIPGVLDNEI